MIATRTANTTKPIKMIMAHCWSVSGLFLYGGHIKTDPSVSKACLKKRPVLFPISIDLVYSTAYYASIVNKKNSDRLIKQCIVLF